MEMAIFPTKIQVKTIQRHERDPPPVNKIFPIRKVLLKTNGNKKKRINKWPQEFIQINVYSNQSIIVTLRKV